MVDSNLSANFRSAETANLSTKRVSAPDPEHPFQTRFREYAINPRHRWFAGGQSMTNSLPQTRLRTNGGVSKSTAILKPPLGCGSSVISIVHNRRPNRQISIHLHEDHPLPSGICFFIRPSFNGRTLIHPGGNSQWQVTKLERPRKCQVSFLVAIHRTVLE